MRPADGGLPCLDDGALRPGMVGKLVIQRRRFKNVIVIPREAIVERETGPVAFVIEGDTVQSRELALGPSQGNRVIAEVGLRAWDRIVVSGGRDLIDGEYVVVREIRQ